MFFWHVLARSTFRARAPFILEQTPALGDMPPHVQPACEHACGAACERPPCSNLHVYNSGLPLLYNPQRYSKYSRLKSTFAKTLTKTQSAGCMKSCSFRTALFLICFDPPSPPSHAAFFPLARASAHCIVRSPSSILKWPICWEHIFPKKHITLVVVY